MQRKKKIINLLLVFTAVVLFSSCRLFKDDCDCPKWEMETPSITIVKVP